MKREVTESLYDGQACHDAYGKMDSKGCDVVLLDYRMPKMDGLQAAREINNVNPKQRMIFTSTTIRDTLRESINELGRIVEIIEKPFEPDVLVRAIEDLTAAEKLRQTKASRFDDSEVDSLLDMLKKIQAAGTI